jgi:hypothetical protein
MPHTNRLRWFLAGIFIVTSVAADLRAEVTVSLSIQDYTWTEELPNGLSLEENGGLFGVRIETELPHRTPAWRSRLVGEGYAGTVDYDGFLIGIDGSISPYESETTYLGVAGSWDIGYGRPLSPDVTAEPFAGIGTHYWLRSLDDEEGFGYDEFWLTMYGRLGLRIGWRTAADTELFAAAVLLLPFYNYEWAVDVPLAAGDGDVELEPEEETGWETEAGLNHGSWHAAVFHTSMDFGQSDLDDTGQFFQPASTREVTGLRIGYRF